MFLLDSVVFCLCDCREQCSQHNWMLCSLSGAGDERKRTDLALGDTATPSFFILISELWFVLSFSSKSYFKQWEFKCGLCFRTAEEINTKLSLFFNSCEGRWNWGHSRCLPTKIFPLSTVQKMQCWCWVWAPQMSNLLLDFSLTQARENTKSCNNQRPVTILGAAGCATTAISSALDF